MPKKIKDKVPPPDPNAVALSPKQAGVYIGMSDAWLRLMRARGNGPPFCKMGKSVRYLRSDLDQWIMSNRREHRSPA